MKINYLFLKIYYGMGVPVIYNNVLDKNAYIFWQITS